MRRNRRGGALILVLLMSLAIAGLSIAAIFLSSSATLLSASYDRDRTFRLAAQAGLEMATSRLLLDSTAVVLDTGMVTLISGEQVLDASGVAIPQARVTVYAAATGDTTGSFVPTITLIALAYDGYGTRHVQRRDLLRESFTRFALFVDSFPTGLTHGPGIVTGRAHTNGTWLMTSTGNEFRDTLSAVVGITGTATYGAGSRTGVTRIPYPQASASAGLRDLATAANLNVVPGSRGSRIEFVTVDVDGDSTIGPGEGFFQVFDLVGTGNLSDTLRLRAAVLDRGNGNSDRFRWDSDVIQHQCGAFYRRSGRWHFFPVSAHRRAQGNGNTFTALAGVIQSTAGGSYPSVSTTQMSTMVEYSYAAASMILTQPTARCFPAGSPYLMPSERFTTGNRPWGGRNVAAPSGGWYGGSDTTFTITSRSCSINSGTNGTNINQRGECTGAVADLGTWRTYTPPAGNSVVSGIPTSRIQATEQPYLWPLSAPYNTAARGVVNVDSSALPIYLSGTVRGRITLRAAGKVVLVDRLKYATDPNLPEAAPCENELGLLARGDILVARSATSRIYRIFSTGGGGSFNLMAGGEPRFTIHGTYLSFGGTVGVEDPAETSSNPGAQYNCPDDVASTAANGGCFTITGGAVMKTYSPLHSGSNSGFLYAGAWDRCMESRRRPPYFPLTGRLTTLRTLEIGATRANTPEKVRAILRSLRGRSL